MIKSAIKRTLIVLLSISLMGQAVMAEGIQIEKRNSTEPVVYVQPAAPTAENPQKVIIDTDMVECFDDGVAMILMDKTPSIELLGVTVVAGNSSMPNGVSSAVRQLEAIGSDTPVYEGSRVGMRPYRVDSDFMDSEETFAPNISWGGYLRYSLDPEKYTTIDMDPYADWKDVYEYKYGESPVYEYVYGLNNPDAEGNRDAVDFLISMANKYPGEITLLAIGPCTNIARAILEDPSFPSKIKEIVYMGGSFYQEGNASAVAEFNWWADPDSAKMCVRAAWGDQESETGKAYGNQIISGLEVSEHAGSMPQDVYEKMVADTYPGIRELFIEKNGDEAPSNIWDVIAAAQIIDPTITIAWNDHEIGDETAGNGIFGVYVDVDSEMTPDYGRSIAYKEGRLGPVGTKKAAIQNYIDTDRFWNEIVYPAMVDPEKK